MNNIILNYEKIFENIRSDFSSLWNVKMRGETLEIITPFSSMLGNMISVFLTQRDERYIISDGKRVCELLSEKSLDSNNKNNTYISETASHYGIKITQQDVNGRCFFFKSTTDINLLSSNIYDLVFFEQAVLNSIYSSQTFFQSDDPQWHRFSTRVNAVLSKRIRQNVEQNRVFTLEKNYKDYNDLRFNAILSKKGSSHLWLAMYISGATPTIFSDHYCRANVGFRYVRKQPELDSTVHLSVVVDKESRGFSEDNKVIDAAKMQVMEYNPQFYDFESFEKIKDLDELFQEQKIM